MFPGSTSQPEQQSADKAGPKEATPATQPPAISVPKGGGAIRGMGEKFAANPVTGTGSMTVPIATSPGRAGFDPELSLSYDSGSGNGPFGFGWSLSLPSITRKTDKGLPRYFDAINSDVFILSGAEDLVPEYKKDNAGNWVMDGDKYTIHEGPRDVDGESYTVRRYRPRIEGLFARIERWTNEKDPGDVFWRSISRDNITTWYGRSTNSRIADPADPTHIFNWLICESHDDKGNAIVYNYKAEDDQSVDQRQTNERNRVRTANRYLKHITYGNHAPYFPELDKNSAWPAPPGIGNWYFEVVFDYDEHDAANPLPDEARTWTVRNDPFSSYRSGFEVRTYRLCQRVLMFHHFPNEKGVGDNCLVRSTDFTYRYEKEKQDPDNPIFSFLLSVTQTGYKRQDNSNYLKKSLPPLDFEYSRLPTEAELNKQPVQSITDESLKNLPIGLGEGYQWVDLDGEGISGILTEQAGAWFYKPNLGNGRFGPQQTVAAIPSLAELNSGRQQLLDLAGDGQLDLVDFSGPTPGFYERTHDEVWATFCEFESRPVIDPSDPNLRFVDLTGDGHADLLITEDSVFTWHLSLAEAGFDRAERSQQAFDEEQGPHLIFADGTQSIYLTDMSGDGLMDLARIRNGEVCYWANLGYGRFGAKVTMDNAPWFDYSFLLDQRRVRLADIDGSGTADIIYLNHDHVDIYRNESGNSWSPPVRLDTFPAVDNLADITVVDLTGSGTACLVWSSPLPGDARRPMRYIDLMAGKKPHLLITVKNNLGAETHIDYASSSKFYLKDKETGKPWITKLPFPVHVVERVVTYDHISRNRFVTCYAYHHGYYDGVEREFRGFGMVEQRDTEIFAAMEKDGLLEDAENLDEAYHVPPVLTKTWFHTGAYVNRDHISNFYAGIGEGDGEYYREPALRGDNGQDVEAAALLLPDTVLPAGLMAEEGREACRALKGSMLRQEIYALDGTSKAEHPYTVTEQNFTIEQLQPEGDNRHSVFFTHAREALNYHYERNPADPRISHALTLEVDQYGNVLKEVAIAYGRRQTIQVVDNLGNVTKTPNPDLNQLDPRDQEKQTQPLITYSENCVTNAIEADDKHRTPLPCETRTYELTSIKPQNDLARFSFEEWTEGNPDLPASAKEIDYEETASHAAPQKRPIEHLRTLFRPDDLGKAQNDPLTMLPLGTVGTLALPGETYQLAFTPGLLQQVFQRPLDAIQLPGAPPPENLLPKAADILPVDPLAGEAGDRGGYVDLDGDDHWWIPSGRVFYSPISGDGAAEELAHARKHFFLPYRYRDPFHTAAVSTETIVQYDTSSDLLETYDLLTAQTTDPLGNTVLARNDYRVLQADLVTGPNGNQTGVAFDALGLVAGTAVMGKAGQGLGDSLDDFKADLTEKEINDLYDAVDPHDSAPGLLKDATTRIVYNLDRFRTTQKDHPEEPEKWQPSYAATLARENHVNALPAGDLKIQIGFTYSDGFSREIQQKIQAEPGPLVKGGQVIDPRWVGSGWTVFNNKGKAVRQYEPFFSNRHAFEFDVRIGVSPILFYDPLQRVVATLHPNHTYQKVLFDPWRQETWDINDTVMQLDPAADPDVGGFFKRLADEEYSPTWHTQRTNDIEALLRWPDTDPNSGEPIPENKNIRKQEKIAAQKTEAHADTPTVAHFDVLGRPFLTIAHNRVICPGHALHGTEEAFETRVELDIEGNQREVFDARGRLVMRYHYNMAGRDEEDEEEDTAANRIHQASMEAGERWILNDVAGNPLRAWDSRGSMRRMTYDALSRPVGLYVGAKQLAEYTLYGEKHPQAQALNLRGQIFMQLDGAGVLTNSGHNPDTGLDEAYDFKGNLLRSERRLAADYTARPDWSALESLLVPGPETSLKLKDIDNALDQLTEQESFASSTTYDALNRPLTATTPDSSVYHPTYNEANLLDSVQVNVRGAAASTTFVANINYNAKGQRELIKYGCRAGLNQNQKRVTTTYEYDENTFHLVNMKTTRPARLNNLASKIFADLTVVQDLNYNYDPAGNITCIADAALQHIPHNNQPLEPVSRYTYDAVYRLIEVKGREHIGQTALKPNPPKSKRRDYPFTGPAHFSAHPNDLQALRTYTERYKYDAAGNFESLRHIAKDGDWTRTYEYEEDSLIKNGQQSNRLTRTQLGNGLNHSETYSYVDEQNRDVHGCMTAINSMKMAWDFEDQLQQVDLNGGGRAYYFYDAGGQRVRKVIERQNGKKKKERIYLGGYEIYRKYKGDGATVKLERETLHVMDDQQRIALVETKTKDTSQPPNPNSQPLFRYQLGNHLGSACLELAADGELISYEEYHPYGTTAFQAGPKASELSLKRYRYTSKERDDESGLYYFGARYYMVWLGRWTAYDPLLHSSHTEETKISNFIDWPNQVSPYVSLRESYSYAKGNPIVFLDPFGMKEESIDKVRKRVIDEARKSLPDPKTGRGRVEEKPNVARKAKSDEVLSEIKRIRSSIKGLTKEKRESIRKRLKSLYKKYYRNIGDYGSNKSEAIQKIWKSIGRGGLQGESWCGAFVASTLVKAGVLDPKRDNAVISKLISAKRALEFAIDTKIKSEDRVVNLLTPSPKSGDIAIRPRRHVMLVVGETSKGLRIIHGNTFRKIPLGGVYEETKGTSKTRGWKYISLEKLRKYILAQRVEAKVRPKDSKGK